MRKKNAIQVVADLDKQYIKAKKGMTALTSNIIPPDALIKSELIA